MQATRAKNEPFPLREPALMLGLAIFAACVGLVGGVLFIGVPVGMLLGGAAWYSANRWLAGGREPERTGHSLVTAARFLGIACVLVLPALWIAAILFLVPR